MEARGFDTSDSRDISAVLALFALVYGRQLDERFYRWRFLDNPFAPPMISLLWDGDILAGHYATCPSRGLIGGSTSLGAQSMTTMTHPNYRNTGVFTKLAAHLYKTMETLGVELVWGFPNSQSHYGFVQRLAWRDILLIPTMTHAIESGSASETPMQLVASLSHTTSLFSHTIEGRNFPSVKDETYLTWRYLNHPTQNYRFIGPLTGDDAVLVVKDYETAGGLALEVVDGLWRDRDAFSRAIRGTVAWARSRPYALVRIWMTPVDPCFPELEKIGFRPREPIAYFCGRALGGTNFADDVWDGRRWCVTMGNSDNY